MQLGMIGFGRMGASLVRRLTKHGHKCVVYDVNPTALKKVSGRGVRVCVSLDMVVAKLSRPRAVWVMVPAAVAGKTVEDPASRMDAGDIIIDGGNSYYRDAVLRAKALERNANAGKHLGETDAETAPLRSSDYCQYSRGGAEFANRVLSAMRKQFGGHDEKKRGSR